MRRAVVAIAIVVAALAAVATRVTLAGRAALAAGDRAFDRGDVPEAIADWQTAARWYLPLAPHVDDAYDRLSALAAHAARDGDPARGSAADRAIRSAALATRGAWAPHAADRAAADAAIPRLQLAGAGTEADASASAARTAWLAEQLARDRRPRGPLAALAVLGICAWLAGAALLVRRALLPSGRIARRPAALGGGIALAGLAAWAIGLYAL